jgi:pimeloyl-ACP methyl ester carboxylesterase
VSRSRTALAVSLALACALPCAAGAASLYSGPSPRPGPDVLYAGPAPAPQLENTGIWTAPPILVSGATAYRHGEFLYQDFLYDDLGADNAYRYPDDPRYAGNAADLVELRLKPLPGETAFRLTYNAMVDPTLVATTIALGDAAAALALPHGANARMPAEVFVTVHGGEADAVDALTGATIATGLPVAVDTARRQVDLRVPDAVFAPGGRSVRIAAATGLWSGAAYLAQPASAFFNVAFRAWEPPSAWRSNAQGVALSTGDLSGFYAVVDFAKLTAGNDDESGVPRTGYLTRIFPSAFEERQGRGDAISRKPGCDAPCVLQYSGRLQPYTLYVPNRPAPPGGFGLTLDLHGCGQTHNIGMGSRKQRQLGERGGGSIVLTPEARGDCYWYFGRAAADVFEAWADVARRYPLDPDLTSIVGSSMGGYGAFKLAAAYPDLFARVGGIAPCPGAGIEWTGVRSLPGGRARSLAPLLPALRGVPVMSWLTNADQTCRYTAQVELLDRLDALGYRYSALTFDGIEHNALASASLADAQPLADFLGDARVERDPARVTYVLSPAVSEPEFGLRADHAHWLSGVVAARASTAGRIDVVSEGITRRASRPETAVSSIGALDTGLAYAAVTQLAGEPQDGRPARRLRITARGIRGATVDAKRARTGCSPSVSFATYELLKLKLSGCNATYSGKTVCHSTPVFDVVVRAPRGERPESLSVTLNGERKAIRGRKVRLDVRRSPSALTRVRVESVDGSGRTQVRLTVHRLCPR